MSVGEWSYQSSPPPVARVTIVRVVFGRLRWTTHQQPVPGIMARRTIVVTGGAGHVGSHLIELLVSSSDDRVISLDNYSNGSRANHIDGAEYREGDTKDIRSHVAETPDILFHLGEYARIKT